MEIQDLIINDSIFLQTLDYEEILSTKGGIESFIPSKNCPYIFLVQLYTGKYDFNKKQLLQLANQLNFLQSGKLIQILILIKENYRQLISQLNDDLILLIDTIDLNEDIELTMCDYEFFDYIIYLEKHSKLKNKNECFKIACKKNRLDIIKFLYDFEDISNETINEGFLIISNTKNYENILHILIYLYNTEKISNETINEAFKLISMHENNKNILPILIYLYNSRKLSNETINEGLIYVARNGNFEAVKYLSNLLEIDIFNSKYHDYGYGVFEYACIFNHLEIAKFIYYNVLKENNDYIKPILTETILSNVIISSELIDWLCVLCKSYTSENDFQHFMRHSLGNAAVFMDLDTIKVLFEFTDINKNGVLDYYKFMFKYSLEKGKIAVSKFLYSQNIPNLLEFITQNFFKNVCKDSLSNLQRFAKENIKLLDEKEKIKIFKDIYYEIITWLCELNDNLKITKEIFEDIFLDGNLKMLEWAYNKEKIIFDKDYIKHLYGYNLDQDQLNFLENIKNI